MVYINHPCNIHMGEDGVETMMVWCGMSQEDDDEERIDGWNLFLRN